jgi:hypothetical protein
MRCFSVRKEHCFARQHLQSKNLLSNSPAIQMTGSNVLDLLCWARDCRLMGKTLSSFVILHFFIISLIAILLLIFQFYLPLFSPAFNRGCFQLQLKLQTCVSNLFFSFGLYLISIYHYWYQLAVASPIFSSYMPHGGPYFEQMCALLHNTCTNVVFFRFTFPLVIFDETNTRVEIFVGGD